MADFFTDAELAEMKKLPEGFEVIPDNLRGHYFVLAIEQVGMVTVTLTRLILQSMRETNKTISGDVGGCAAGLQRASHYVRGLRPIHGYVKPVAVPGAVAAPDDSQEVLDLTPNMKVKSNE